MDSPRADEATRGPLRTEPAGETPRVSVVVVNYNGGESLGGCLDAPVAGRGEGAEVLAGGNDSPDRRAAVPAPAADRHESLRLLRSPTNRGYAGAVNVALPEARGDYVAVLNVDVVVSSGWLDSLVALLDSRPDAGAACPLILLGSDPGRINAAGQNLNKT